MRIIPFLVVFLCMFSCSSPNRFIVSNLGYEPVEVKESLIYSLPQTSLKVTINYKREIFIPGPYADYAMKLLGIQGVQKSRQERYGLVSASAEEIIETDASQFYSINAIEGTIDRSVVDWAKANNLIIYGDYDFNTRIDVPVQQDLRADILFKDVTMEPNTEFKTETIYKTVLTDTSFIRVPVTSEQMERKTLEKKAEEAAKLILEIRTDRYYISAGLLDPFPVNFEMNTALQKLDKLEQEYLSLFIGKSYTENFSKDYFVTPEGSLDNELIELDKFSSDNGLNKEGNEILRVVIEPDGNSESFRNLLPQRPEGEDYNRFYYRIPELCKVKVMGNNEVIYFTRMSIYQAGSLVSIKLREE